MRKAFTKNNVFMSKAKWRSLSLSGTCRVIQRAINTSVYEWCSMQYHVTLFNNQNSKLCIYILKIKLWRFHFLRFSCNHALGKPSQLVYIVINSLTIGGCGSNATGHYLSQWWPRSMSPYPGVTRPRWSEVPHAECLGYDGNLNGNH